MNGPFPSASPRSARALLLTLWQIAMTGANGLLWQSVRESTIDVRRLRASVRLLTVTGIAAVLLMLVSLLFSDAIRQGSDLVALREAVGTRGLMVPVAIIPLTILGVTLAWAYLLTGTHHLRWPFRLGILLLYLIGYAGPMLFFLWSGDFWAWRFVLSVAALALLLLALLVTPQGRLPLPLLWCGVLLLQTTPMLLLMPQLTMPEPLSWTARLASNLATNAFLLVIPFLLIAGAEWFRFARDVAGWLAEGVRSHAPLAVAQWLLGIILVLRLLWVGWATWQGRLAMTVGGMGGALLFVAGLLLVALLLRRRGTEAEVPGQLVVLLILLSLLPQMLFLVAMMLSTFVLAPLAVLTNDSSRFDLVTLLFTRLSNQEPAFRPALLALIAAGVALIAWKRQRYSIAGYALILAWERLLAWLSAPQRPLAALAFDQSEVALWLVLGMAVLALAWWRRGTLTMRRAVYLLLVVLLLTLLDQTDFLDNPFSPLFAFAGVFFLVFSIFWSVLTAGTFANQETPRLPRPARLLLYIGYALLSVVVAQWFLVIHDVPRSVAQATFNLNGFLIFGLPLAYLLIIEQGLAAADGRAETALVEGQ